MKDRCFQADATGVAVLVQTKGVLLIVMADLTVKLVSPGTYEAILKRDRQAEGANEITRRINLILRATHDFQCPKWSGWCPRLLLIEMYRKKGPFLGVERHISSGAEDFQGFETEPGMKAESWVVLS